MLETVIELPLSGNFVSNTCGTFSCIGTLNLFIFFSIVLIAVFFFFRGIYWKPLLFGWLLWYFCGCWLLLCRYRVLFRHFHSQSDILSCRFDISVVAQLVFSCLFNISCQFDNLWFDFVGVPTEPTGRWDRAFHLGFYSRNFPGCDKKKN